MTKANAIKGFVREITGLNFSVKKLDHWETDCYDTIYYAFDETEETAIAFRANFVKRCTIADNFLDATLSILHEVGHICTTNETDGIYPDEETCTNEEYFNTHDEWIATEWAIDWLNNKDNQNLAKVFEKNWLTSR